MLAASGPASWALVADLAERIVGRQVEQYDQHVRTAGDLVRLGVAALAGIIGIMGLVLNAVGSLSVWESVGVLVAIVLLVTAVVAEVQAYGGRQSVLRIGPGLERLTELMEESPDAVDASVMESWVSIVEANAHALDRVALLRVMGFRMMVAAVLAFLATLVLIVGGRVYA